MKEKIVIGSVTYALKAKKELSQRGIRTRVVKASQRESSGCTYGIEIEASERFRIYAILDELGISYQRKSDQR